jgi:iron(III) transport system substrate-binding protein
VAKTEAEVPDSVFDVTDPKWKGRVGFAPTNASFQAFVTGMRVLVGNERAEQWLRDFLANSPKVYENNLAILDAIDAGQVDIGLVNHYYALEKKAERPDFKAANHFLAGNDPGALVNVAGIGVLDPTPEATRLVEYMLSEPAQRYFAQETFEYPLSAGVAPPTGLPPLAELDSPQVDLSRLDDLEATLKLLDEVGAT